VEVELPAAIATQAVERADLSAAFNEAVAGDPDIAEVRVLYS